MELTPKYVLVENDYIEVSAFKHLRPNERPTARCPQCGEIVILRLGEINQAHFAHRKDSRCKWSPETIVHFEAKVDLAKELEKVTNLRPTTLCPTCKKYRLTTEDFVTGWDKVEVEFQFGPYRADIALLSKNQLVAVIEILVSHETEQDKATFLNTSGVQWIELAVSSHARPWKVDTPNILVNADRVGNMRLERKVCSICTSLAEMKKQAVVARASSSKQQTIHGFTFFDVFYVHGGYMRYPIWRTQGYMPYRAVLQSQHKTLEMKSGEMSDEYAIKVVQNFVKSDPDLQRIIHAGGHVICHHQMEACSNMQDLYTIIDDINVPAYVWLNGGWQSNEDFNSAAPNE